MTNKAWPIARLKNENEVFEIFRELLFKHTAPGNKPMYWICGGALRDTFISVPFNDIDIYTESSIHELFIKHFLMTNAKLVEEKNHLYNFEFNGLKIQLIKNSFSTRIVEKMELDLPMIEKILLSFDFTCNSIALSDTGEFLFPNATRTGSVKYMYAIQTTLERGILSPNFHALKNPINTIKRAVKFSIAGWTLSTSEIARLCDGIKELKKGTNDLLEDYYNTYGE